MILSAICYVLYSILYVITLPLTALSDVSSNGAIISAVVSASGYFSAFYQLIPAVTTTLLAVISFDIIFETFYFTYKVIYWGIKKIPTIS